jgi:tetratricopeptide (TPR) repeat protein
LRPCRGASRRGIWYSGCARYWEQGFRELEGVERKSGVAFLWGRIVAFPFIDTETGRLLRTKLIKQLLTLMGEAAFSYFSLDLCRGYLYLQLGDYVAAETYFRQLLECFPENSRLGGYLADAFWLQGRREIANGV